MYYDYSYKKPSRSTDFFGWGGSRMKRRERGKNYKKTVIIAFVVILFFIIINNLFLKPKSTSPRIPIVVSSGQIKNKPLDEQIQEILNNKQGNYSILIVNYSTGERFAINDTAIYTAASVIKIPTLAGLYYFADNGEIDLDKSITLQEKDIQDYGTGILRYEKSGSVYSLKTLARILMEKSDNTADYILTRQIIGNKKLQNQLTNWGLTQTSIDNNKTSNKDIELLLHMMYEGKIASPALTTEMIGLMDDSDFEDRIPALLPDNTKVYHKIGNEVGNVHDTGIVESPNAIYYIGVLSSDITDEQDGISTIAQVSKAVYDYFN